MNPTRPTPLCPCSGRARRRACGQSALPVVHRPHRRKGPPPPSHSRASHAGPRPSVRRRAPTIRCRSSSTRTSRATTCSRCSSCSATPPSTCAASPSRPRARSTACPGIRNARRVLAALGRTEVPVACGRENPGPNGRWFPPEWRAGADAFYGVELPAVSRRDRARRDRAGAPRSPRGRQPTRRSRWSPSGRCRTSRTPRRSTPRSPRTSPGSTRWPARSTHRATSRTATRRPPTASSGTSARTPTRWRPSSRSTSRSPSSASTRPTTCPVPADIVDQLSADHGRPAPTSPTRCTSARRSSADGGSSYWDSARRGHAHRPVRRRTGRTSRSRCSPRVRGAGTCRATPAAGRSGSRCPPTATRS